MSSNGTNGGGGKRKDPPAPPVQGQAKKPPKRVNPYAKKRQQVGGSSTPTNQSGSSLKSPPPRSVANSTTTPAGKTDNKLNPVRIGTNTTFSQAFSNLEDTTHFRSSVASLANRRNNNNNDNQDGSPLPAGLSEAQLEERKKQRQFDSELDLLQSEKDERARLQARDKHELLQPHVLHVSNKQRGNGLLQYIRNVPYAFTDMVPDYIFHTERCALFLSMKYHNLFPVYIQRRISELKTDFRLRVLLVLVDVDDNEGILRFLNRLCVVHDMTLILAWSEEEAARYLETFKAYDGKDATLIQKREQTNFVDQVADFLTSARSVNKTDSSQLLSQFGSVRSLMAASMDELALCPGMGEKKVRRLYNALHMPFYSKRKRGEGGTSVGGKENTGGNDETDESKKSATRTAAVTTAATKS